MKKIIPVLAALCYVFTFLSCPVWAQSKEEGMRLYREGLAIESKTHSKDDLDRAMGRVERTLRIFERVGFVKGIGDANHDLGCSHERLSQWNKAAKYYEKAIVIRRKLGDKRNEAESLLGMGSTYANWGQSRKAAEYLDKALGVALKLMDSEIEADALVRLAHVYRDIGEEDKAAQFCAKALAIYKSSGKVGDEGDALLMLGALYQDRGQYHEAIESYRGSLEIAHKTGSPREESSAFLMLGRVYREIGQYDRATECCQKSADLAKQIGDAQGEGFGLREIGRVQAERGDYKAALDMLQKAVAAWKRTGFFHPRLRFEIANVYFDLGDIERAESYAKSIIGGPLYFPLYVRDHLLEGDYQKAKEGSEGLLKFAEKRKDTTALFVSWVGLALAYEGMQDYPKAAEYFTKAVDQSEEMRAGLSAAERARFFDVKVMGFARTEPYEGLTRVLMKLNKPVEALKQSEYTKARIFAESMSRRSSEATVKVPGDVLKEDLQLNDHLASLIKKRQAGYEKGNREVIDSVEPQIKQVKSELQSHIDMLRKEYPLFAATKYPQPMDVEQTAVKPDEWTLAYQVTDTGICMWLLKGKTLVKSLFKPIARKELNQLVRSFRKPLDMDEITPKNLLAFKDALGTGKKLFDMLVGDFLASIPEGQPLIILPDGMLGVLPFEMLVIKEGTGWNTSGPRPYPEGVAYFGDRNPISYYQSLTALTLARTLGHTKKTGPRTLVMADPVFQSDDPRLLQAERKRRQKLLASVSGKLMSIKNETGLVFNRLPLTGDLGTALKKLQPDLTDLFTGMHASKPLLFKEKLDRYRTVVFATHGYVGESLPGIMEPVLILTLVGQPKDKDGFLRMSEVMSLDLSADVVALTACQTGLGREVKGEGTMGMGRAFQYAGAKSVLMSLWSVSEVSTTKMTEKFLSYIKQGKNRLEALQMARKEIRSEGYEHPFYWAPFILVGEVK